MVRSFNYKDKIWKNLTLKVIKFQMTKNHLLYIVSVWCCQDDERRHIFADKNCILFVARFPSHMRKCLFSFPSLLHNQTCTPGEIRLNMIKPRLTGNLTNSFNRETPFTQTWLLLNFCYFRTAYCLPFVSQLNRCLFALKNGIFFTRPI